MKYHPLKKIAWVLILILLAGCHKLETTTSIKPNGSGELQTGVGFSAEERANIEKQYANSQDFCNTSQTPENVSVTEEQRNDETWCVTTTQFTNLDDLRALYEKQKGLTVNRLEISDGKFYYDVEYRHPFGRLEFFHAHGDHLVGRFTRYAHFSQRRSSEWKHPRLETDIEKRNRNLQAESEVPRGFNLPSCGTALIGFGVVFVHLRKKRFGAS